MPILNVNLDSTSKIFHKILFDIHTDRSPNKLLAKEKNKHERNVSHVRIVFASISKVFATDI